jgi:hypothetical protein
MQIQCHIVLYLPDYHVNTHRVCSVGRRLIIASGSCTPSL